MLYSLAAEPIALTNTGRAAAPARLRLVWLFRFAGRHARSLLAGPPMQPSDPVAALRWVK
jgi:hypothetical protein